MAISKEDAIRALAEVENAQGRMTELSAYSQSAPYAMMWGVIWMVGNLTMEFIPRLSGWAWGIGVLIGTSVGIYLGWRQARTNRNPRRYGRRYVLLFISIGVFMTALVTIAGPVDPRQGNALMSIFWASLYMGVGAWIGLRIFILGAVTVAAVLFAYLALDQYYFLWMAIAGGGSLFLGGLWLRKA